VHKAITLSLDEVNNKEGVSDARTHFNVAVGLLQRVTLGPVFRLTFRIKHFILR
jgi:hypothetical protein